MPHQPYRRLVAAALAASVWFASLSPGTATAAPSSRAGKEGAPGRADLALRTCGSTKALAQAPWPVFDGDAVHSGDGVDVTGTAGALHQKWRTPQLDGAVYAQPVLAGGCLFVATEDDTVYAFGAATGVLVWRAHLAEPVTSGLPCGDINPSGITGTPVLDAEAGELWVVVLTDGTGGAEHQLVALKTSDGQVLRRQEIAVPGRNPAAEQERSALVLDNGNVYVALGGLYGDCNDYAGAVVSVPERGGSPAYWAVPTAREAGIWEPGGPDVLADGNLLLADGNGAASSGQPFDESDAVIELSPALKVAGYFAPSDWARLSADDLDLGSTGPAVLPGGLAAQVGKDGVGYLVNTSRLDGIGGQLATVQVCQSGAGAYGADAVSGNTVYFPCQGGLVAVQVKARAMHVLWRSAGGDEGSPVIAGGRIFEETGSGQLQAFSPTTGRVLQALSFSSPVTHFPWLVAVGRTLYAPDGTSVVALSGL